jgi:hypothetical protein
MVPGLRGDAGAAAVGTILPRRPEVVSEERLGAAVVALASGSVVNRSVVPSMVATGELVSRWAAAAPSA